MLTPLICFLSTDVPVWGSFSGGDPRPGGFLPGPFPLAGGLQGSSTWGASQYFFHSRGRAGLRDLVRPDHLCLSLQPALCAGCLHLLTTVRNAFRNPCTRLCVRPCSHSVGVYPRSRLVAQTARLYLASGGVAVLFSAAVAPRQRCTGSASPRPGHCSEVSDFFF